MTVAMQDVLVVPLNRAKTTKRLYVVPGVDGQFGPFGRFAERLREVAVWGLVVGPTPAPGTTLPGIAAALLERVLGHAGEEPVRLAGFSFGAYVAAELACQAAERDRAPADLLLLDTLVLPGRQPESSSMRTHWRIGERNGLTLSRDEFAALDPEQRIEAVCRDWPGGADPAATRKWVEHLFTTVDRNLAALAAHRVRRYDGRAGVVAARHSKLTRPEPALWRPAFPRGVAMEVIPGEHADIASGRNPVALARAVQALLDRESVG